MMTTGTGETSRTKKRWMVFIVNYLWPIQFTSTESSFFIYKKPEKNYVYLISRGVRKMNCLARCSFAILIMRSIDILLLTMSCIKWKNQWASWLVQLFAQMVRIQSILYHITSLLSSKLDHCATNLECHMIQDSHFSKVTKFQEFYSFVMSRHFVHIFKVTSKFSPNKTNLKSVTLV